MRYPLSRRGDLRHRSAAGLDARRFLYLNDLRRILAGVAGVAIPILLVRHGVAERLEREIAQRIGLHKSPDLLDGVIRRDQFMLGRRIDSVIARGDRRRTRDTQMYFARAR